jgi:hypothetical protein
MRIDSYNFGRILVDDTLYTKDLIISRRRIRTDWRREQGHLLSPDDIRAVIEEERPDVLVIGRGKLGRMRVSPETLKYLKEKGVSCVAKNTDSACKKFNELVDRENVVGAFHLTC